ncbi:peptidoglycan DD-metalloendopeptidase family protein [Lunatibacter salilacus]|uniref:peptidoglycan DD-metalloendopeptidase family protein n=1 Tax=Lunatibacter salilacus TaxID=2483804 RepID=UPI001F2CA52B|nr:peptidoglycan DD-metalloendopeptidase family protein [Lunatibacter salilacus]
MAMDQKALIIGGFHGDEQPGYEMVDGLVNELRNGTGPANTELAFHTLIIPRLNRGAIEDHLSGVTSYDRRCNRQLVDLNRSLPVFGNNRSSPRCPNSATAPVQPENQAVIFLTAGARRYRYAHLSARQPAGQYSAGSTIGQTGVTGNAVADRPHLHLEVQQNNRAIDPAGTFATPNMVRAAFNPFAITNINFSEAENCNPCAM